MGAPIFYIERDLFLNSSDWVSNKGDSINKPPSDYFEASMSPDSTMLVTNGSLKAWGGALVSRKRGVPSANGKLLNWLAYRLKFRFPKGSAENTGRHELDIKVCVKSRPSSTIKIRNVANFSTQYNNDTGQFQIDLDPPGWVNTGFVIDEITPDVWHTIEFRFWFDDVACVFSVLSIQYDEQLYMIPEDLQNVLMQLTNWEQVASEQLQNELYQARSTVVIEYDEGVLAWSDQRIAMIPAEALRRSVDAEFWWPPDEARGILLGGDFDPFGPDAESEARQPSKFDVRR